MTTEYDPHDLGGHEAAQALEAKAVQMLRDVEESDFKWLMAHKQGRRVMWRLLGMTGLFSNPFSPGRDGTTEFRCGAQNVGQKLMDEIHGLCPEQYHAMVREAQAHAKAHKGVAKA